MNKKSSILLEKPIVLILLIFAFLAVTLIFFGIGQSEGLFRKAADTALYAERFLPFRTYDEKSVSKEEIALMNVQKAFLDELKLKIGGKTNCMVLHSSLSELDDNRLIFTKRGLNSIVYIEKPVGTAELEGGDEEQIQRISPIEFPGGFCIIDAVKFCSYYNLGDNCLGGSPLSALYIDLGSIILSKDEIFINGKNYEYNKRHLFKAEENKFCFILNHRRKLPIGCDANAEDNTLDDDCNDNLRDVVGMCY